MRKLFVLLATISMVGCGGSSARDNGLVGPTPDPNEGPTGTVTLPQIAAGTTLAKVIVRRNQLTPIPIYDENGDIVGTTNILSEVFKYVVNVDPAAATTLPIPYGANYTIEVIAGGDAVGGVRPILGYYRSDLFDVPATLAPSLPLQDLTPVITPPGAIYVGLSAPYDTYVVSLSKVAYPWATGGWAVTCNGAAPLTVKGSKVTFASPTVAGTLAYEGKFHLDKTLLLSGETDSSWEITATASATPASFGDVSFIP